MNEKGNQYALAALKDRRATIASEIMRLRDQVAKRVEQLSHINATIKVLDPSFNPDTAPPKRYRRVHLFGDGELSRSVLDVLRRGGEPMTAPEIITAFMLAKGYEGPATKAIAHRIRASLSYQRRCNRVVKAGDRLTASWRLV